MRRELRVGIAALPRRRIAALVGWSVLEALPGAVTGLAVANAVDGGFLAGRPAVGLAWLGGLVLAACVGAVASRQVWRGLGDVVEPFRDDLVRRVVGGALRHGVAGHADDGAVARLTRQVEIVRDSFAGIIVLLTGFAVSVVGVTLGLVGVDPVLALLVLPPFLLGVALFVALLGAAAARYRAAARAEERLARTGGDVLAAVRDVVACGTEEHAARLATAAIDAQAAAERALARTATQRTVVFAVGGWLPLVVLLAAGPWLVARGLTAGAIMGGLTYVLLGLQPLLHSVTGAVGDAGLRFVVTLGRILDADPPAGRARPGTAAGGPDLVLRGVGFRYGPHADPVLHDLDLTVAAGDHLAVVGPSGIGKSTLAALLCGLRTPTAGTVCLGGVPASDVDHGTRVLVPQEAYVFAGPIRDNLTYLAPGAGAAEIDRALDAVGAGALVARLGGPGADLVPATLSAGERQLIALARAYLSPAPLVVLDEATCYLDPAAERRAEEAFAARGATVVVIAHRISSALRAPRVLVLDGRSAAVGDHAELRASSPLYRDLLGHWLPTAPARTG